MKAERKVSGENWDLDGDTITVRIPMQWKRRGERKVIIVPDGSDAPGRRRSPGPTRR